MLARCWDAPKLKPCHVNKEKMADLDTPGTQSRPGEAPLLTTWIASRSVLLDPVPAKPETFRSVRARAQGKGSL